MDILPVLKGNDFGLDDLFFGEIAAFPDSITVTVSKNIKPGHYTLLTPPDQHNMIASSFGLFEKYTWNSSDVHNQFLSVSRVVTG
ncbi:MAG: hypothetical protein Q7U54_18760 [Bacteroidales bacterium]|nr:hypothetical protein [Bacteroidales bacterium]